MSGLFKLALTIVFSAVIFWLVIVNRFAVDISFDPFLSSVSVPLAAIIFCSVLLGFFWGAVIVWLNGSSMRRDFRAQKKEIKKLQEQNPSI